MDFTIDKYKELLVALKNSGLAFRLRHDVDRLPQNSLRTAQIETQLNLKATYFFRVVPESYDEEIIKEIHSLGHEIGYHYESLTTCNGDVDAAYQDFCTNLEKLRQMVPVDSICMHGSPRSPWDSKDIWKKYDYRQLGIVYEPYLDTDFSKTLYLTDTGRRWDGYHVSVRDKVPFFQEKWESEGLSFHTTDDIIEQLQDRASILNKSGYTILMTTHPQRWNSFGMQYIKEFCLQSIKNNVKRFLIKRK
jgi:hypothetical protein